jgi:hypothetical protein
LSKNYIAFDLQRFFQIAPALVPTLSVVTRITPNTLEQDIFGDLANRENEYGAI